jgi:hypothetical protein
MDWNRERKKLNLLVFGIVLFVVSGFYAYEEGVYFLIGRRAQATITKVSLVTTTGRYGPRKHLQVDFAFVEPNGTKRTGDDSTSTDWVAPATGIVPVDYTPGVNGRARFAGRVKWLVLILFFCCLGVVVFFAIRLWIEASEATRPRKKKRRRYVN